MAGKGDALRKGFDPEKFGKNYDKIDFSSDDPSYRKEIKFRPGLTRYVYGNTQDKFERKKQYNENRKLIRDKNGKLKR